MTGFELWISGIGSDRSTNCATIIARLIEIVRSIGENFWSVSAAIFSKIDKDKWEKF